LFLTGKSPPAGSSAPFLSGYCCCQGLGRWDVEEKSGRNFWVNREMRTKFCIYNHIFDEF
jgi:hypothetical protein